VKAGLRGIQLSAASEHDDYPAVAGRADHTRWKLNGAYKFGGWSPDTGGIPFFEITLPREYIILGVVIQV